MGHFGAIRTTGKPNPSTMMRGEISGFVRQCTGRASSDLRVLGCYPANAESFYLHLGEPSGQASLVIPVAYEWVEERKLGDVSSAGRLERVLTLAAMVLESRGRLHQTSQTG